MNRRVTIPFGFRKSEEEGRLRDFERAAGRRPGAFEGKMPFNDTDVYKLIEGASYSLQTNPDPQLDRFLDGIIALIAAAQEPDGYLTTYKTIDPSRSPADWLKPGPKWDLELQGSHELYNSGHLFEAAYAHYRATGKRTLLHVALRNADLLDRTFGPGKRLTPPGHQIVETGLFKLAELTGEERYRRLARFFLDQRGNAAGHELNGPYNQDHAPVVQQREAVGHAVRAAYMYSAMVDVATLEDDPLYREAVERIWTDVVGRKLYLTGGIGSRHDGEAFGAPFELPNRTAYSETCASIANVYWNQRMFLQSGDAKYVDVLERTLYNAAIAGVSLSGDLVLLPEPARVRRPLRVQPGRAHAQAVVRLLLLPHEPGPLHPLAARLRLRHARRDALREPLRRERRLLRPGRRPRVAVPGNGLSLGRPRHPALRPGPPAGVRGARPRAGMVARPAGPERAVPLSRRRRARPRRWRSTESRCRSLSATATRFSRGPGGPATR